MLVIKCKSCEWGNAFEQPYPYHAGHADQGFLYNDAGNLTLVWSSFDSCYKAIVGQKHPWTLSPEDRAAFESALLPAPLGGRWRFNNPARCKQCGEAISEPITRTIYYLEYEGSIITDADPANREGLKDFMQRTA
jgi:hypothetical protein